MSFLNDLTFGGEGEEWLEQWLEYQGIPCENTKKQKGHDILIPNSYVKIEVKSDRYALKTGNILFEIWSHKDLKHPGWIQYSSAEILCYLLYKDKVVREIILYDFMSLRHFVFWNIMGGSWYNKPILGIVKTGTVIRNNNVNNLLIPREHLRNFEVDVSTLKQRKEVDKQIGD